MKTDEKIAYANQRIKELKQLIRAWSPKEKNISSGYLDFRITEDQFLSMKETTQEELNNLINNVY